MGSDPQITKRSSADLHGEVLPLQTQEAFKACINFPFLEADWYLAGGTALALQVGHRSSEDLDFFTSKKDFDIELLERLIPVIGTWETTQTEKGTLYGTLHGASVSFIAYPFYRPSNNRVYCGTIHMLVPDDIMAMKIVAVSQRGKKRDFVDLYWYLAIHGASLPATIQRTLEQFPDRQHNLPHFIKSLTYFDDAEDDPMPALHFDANWETIKKYFQNEIPRIAKELLEISDNATR